MHIQLVRFQRDNQVTLTFDSLRRRTNSNSDSASSSIRERSFSLGDSGGAVFVSFSTLILVGGDGAFFFGL